MSVVDRGKSIRAALSYRGREGMWSWMLHRATGLGILLFLLIHVVTTATVIYWPDFYDEELALYRHPFFRFAELLIFFAVLFHAFNGLRIIVQDFWPIAMRHQRQLAYAAAGLTAVAMIPVAWIMLAPLFGLAEEPGAERHRERMRLREATAAAEAPAPAGQAIPVEIVR